MCVHAWLPTHVAHLKPLCAYVGGLLSALSESDTLMQNPCVHMQGIGSPIISIWHRHIPPPPCACTRKPLKARFAIFVLSPYSFPWDREHTPLLINSLVGLHLMSSHSRWTFQRLYSKYTEWGIFETSFSLCLPGLFCVRKNTDSYCLRRTGQNCSFEAAVKIQHWQSNHSW